MRERENIASASKTAAQKYRCLVRKVRLTWLLRLARLFCDSLSILAPLTILLHRGLFASLCLTTSLGPALLLGLATGILSTFAQFGRFVWLGSSVLLGSTLICSALSLCLQFCSVRSLRYARPPLLARDSRGSFPLLVSFAQRGPCPALCSFLKQLLVKFFVPAMLFTRTFSFYFTSLDCVELSAQTTCSLLALSLCCASLAPCLLCFFVVSLCHTECSRNNTHSIPQPSTVMLCQPVFGSFQHITPALVTPCNVWYTPLAPFITLPSLHPQCFTSPSTTQICRYTCTHWLPAAAQHFHTQRFPSPSTCMYTKSRPALS